MRKWFAWWIRVQQARADREVLSRFGARALRDIGMPSCNAELVDRAEVERERRLQRIAAARVGTY